MLKLILCLVSAVAVSIVLLQMRQQEMDLRHTAALLHAKVRTHQAELWNQQIQIAIYTSPRAIAKTVRQYDLKTVPLTPLPEMPSWINPQDNPNAE